MEIGEQKLKYVNHFVMDMNIGLMVLAHRENHLGAIEEMDHHALAYCQYDNCLVAIYNVAIQCSTNINEQNNYSTSTIFFYSQLAQCMLCLVNDCILSLEAGYVKVSP